MAANSDEKQKGDFKPRDFYMRAGVILIICLIIFMTAANIKMYLARKRVISKIENYSAQIERITQSNKILEEEIANSDDPDYIEKVAREQENMQKTGEKVVSFVVPREEPASSAQRVNSWLGWLAGAWRWVKSKF